MPNRRDHIPRELERALLIESGHRCAIPTCRAVAPLEIDHIDDWARVREHKFENMIVLCRNCHGLKGDGPRQLNRQALRQYKVNLGVVNSRYGDTERRVLEFFANNPLVNDIMLPGGLDILLLYLIKDGLLAKPPPAGGIYFGSVPMHQPYFLTEAGREFVSRWSAAQPVSGEVQIS
jgi:hypothetical protein